MLINDILDFSKIEAGKLEIETIDFDLLNTIQGAVKMLTSKAQEKGLEMSLVFEDNVPSQLRVVLEKQPENIDQQTIPQIDVRDRRVLVVVNIEESRKVLNKTISSLGSWVQETDAGYSAFEDNNKKNVELITRHTLEENREKRGLQILVAEDNKVNQRLVQRFLEKMGHQVDIVLNGKEALNALNRNSYELILMDCNMPEMDGFEATACIRNTHSDFKEIPIIALTGNALKGDRERCLAAGMDGYVSKPVQRNELFDEIERLSKKQFKHAFVDVDNNDKKKEKVAKVF